MLACRSSGDNAELLASRIFGDAAAAAAAAPAPVATAADDEDDEDDDEDDDNEDDDDDDNNDDDDDDDDDDGDHEADEADEQEDEGEEAAGEEENSDTYDDGDDDDNNDDEIKYGNAVADSLLSEAVTQQHEGCGDDVECDMATIIAGKVACALEVRGRTARTTLRSLRNFRGYRYRCLGDPNQTNVTRRVNADIAYGARASPSQHHRQGCCPRAGGGCGCVWGSWGSPVVKSELSRPR